MSTQSIYLVVDGDGNGRVIKRRWTVKLKPYETMFEIKLAIPPKRFIEATIDVTLDERIVTVDGIAMVPLCMTYQTTEEATS